MDKKTIDELDFLLKWRLKQPTYLSFSAMTAYLEDRRDLNLRLLVNTLIDDGLFNSEQASKGNMIYITKLGEEIAKNSSYMQFMIDKDAEIAEKKRIKDLEVLNLEQSVKKGSIEYWFMIAGGIGGFISFVITIWQLFDKK